MLGHALFLHWKGKRDAFQPFTVRVPRITIAAVISWILITLNDRHHVKNLVGTRLWFKKNTSGRMVSALLKCCGITDECVSEYLGLQSIFLIYFYITKEIDMIFRKKKRSYAEQWNWFSCILRNFCSLVGQEFYSTLNILRFNLKSLG